MLIKVDKRTTFSTETNLQPDQQRKVPDLLTPPYPEILFKYNLNAISQNVQVGTLAVGTKTLPYMVLKGFPNGVT